jgi:hypothetical protein
MAGFMYAWRWGDCGTAGPHSPPAYIGAGGTVRLGFRRIVAFHHRSENLYQIHCYIRQLCF